MPKGEMLMQGKFLKVTLLSMSIALSVVPLRAEAKVVDEHAVVKMQCYSQSMVKLKGDLRKLWLEHMLWTRSYLISALAGLDDQEKVLARLLKNQKDIGNAIKPYYGEVAGNKLGDLLTEHIVIAGKVVAAAKSGNAPDFEKYNNEWYRNADDTAAFLSKANPNWPMKTLQDMLYGHLQLLTNNVSARLKKDWDADIAAFDQGEEHIIMLADLLSDGIIKQFPKQFK
jgi:REP element-mobilizing transposase RayT